MMPWSLPHDTTCFSFKAIGNLLIHSVLAKSEYVIIISKKKKKKNIENRLDFVRMPSYQQSPNYKRKKKPLKSHCNYPTISDAEFCLSDAQSFSTIFGSY